MVDNWSRPLRAAVMSSVMVLPLSSYALGLGQITVHSALNQKLVAQIRLMSVDTPNLADIQVNLASEDAYAKVGFDNDYVATKLRFSVTRDQSGEPIILVRSDERVTEPYLRFLLEATSPNGHYYRAYTILLDPSQYQNEDSVPATPASKPTPLASTMPDLQASEPSVTPAQASEVPSKASEPAQKVATDIPQLDTPPVVLPESLKQASSSESGQVENSQLNTITNTSAPAKNEPIAASQPVSQDPHSVSSDDLFENPGEKDDSQKAAPLPVNETISTNTPHAQPTAVNNSTTVSTTSKQESSDEQNSAVKEQYDEDDTFDKFTQSSSAQENPQPAVQVPLVGAVKQLNQTGSPAESSAVAPVAPTDLPPVTPDVGANPISVKGYATQAHANISPLFMKQHPRYSTIKPIHIQNVNNGLMESAPVIKITQNPVVSANVPVQEPSATSNTDVINGEKHLQKPGYLQLGPASPNPASPDPLPASSPENKVVSTLPAVAGQTSSQAVSASGSDLWKLIFSLASIAAIAFARLAWLRFKRSSKLLDTPIEDSEAMSLMDDYQQPDYQEPLPVTASEPAVQHAAPNDEPAPQHEEIHHRKVRHAQQQVVELSPIEQAQIYLNYNNTREAAEVLRRALDVTPDDAMILCLLLDLLFDLNAKDEFIARYIKNEELLKACEPKEFAIITEKAKSWLDEAKLAESELDSARSLNMNSLSLDDSGADPHVMEYDPVSTQLELAIAYITMKEFDEAREILNTICAEGSPEIVVKAKELLKECA